MAGDEDKNKSKASGSGSGSDQIDQFDPLYLHSNDTNGIPLINFKHEGLEHYKVWSVDITIAIYTKKIFSEQLHTILIYIQISIT